MDYDDFMKKMKNGAGADAEDKENDVDDEFAALEKEVLGEKKKGKKPAKKSKAAAAADDDDSDLSGLSDEDEDNDKDSNDSNQKAKSNKTAPKEIKKTPEVSKAPINQYSKPKITADVPNPNTNKYSNANIKAQALPSISNPIEPIAKPKPKPKEFDVYTEQTEKIYHNVDKMKAMSVLENELAVCDNIIKFKKDNGYDNYAVWETKKVTINANMEKISNMIEEGKMDVVEYKKLIKAEFDFDQKLMNFVLKDKKIESYEVNVIKERISERMKKIESELTEEVEEEKEDTEEGKGTAKETHPGSVSQPVSVPVSVIKKETKANVTPELKREVKPKEKMKSTSSPNKPESIKESSSPNSDPKKEIKESTPSKPEGKKDTKPTKEKEAEEDAKPKPKPKQMPKENKDIEEVKAKPMTAKETLLFTVQERLTEYKEAIDYFKSNNLTSQLEIAINDAKSIVKLQKQIEDGTTKKISETSLPPSLTPEYICGYSDEERLSKYKEILTHLITQSNDIKAKMNDMIEKTKSINQSQQTKALLDKVKKDLDEMKKRKDQIERITQTLKDNLKNPWRPAPLYNDFDEEEKVEKVNSDIPVNSVQVYLGKTDYIKDNIYAIVTVGNERESALLNKKDSYNMTRVFTLNSKEYRHLIRGLEISIYRKHWYHPNKPELKGNVFVKLEALKSQSEIKGEYEIGLLSKRFVPKLEVGVKIRSPLVEKEYDVKMKKSLQVTKILPPFRGEGSTTTTTTTSSISNSTNKESMQSKSIIKEQPKPQPQPKQQSQSQQTPNKPIESKAKVDVDKSQFSSDELKNPDCIDNLNTMEVLSLKEKHLDEKIKKIEGRTPKELREQLVRIKCKKKVLEEQLGEGALTPEAYLEIMKKQLQHDKSLHAYFEQENDKEKSNLVAPRITLLIKEMNETLEYLKENAK